jgi:chromosome segregation ATPase
MTYRLKYSRLHSFGSFENRSVGLEEDFEDSVPAQAALEGLVQKVMALHRTAPELEKRILGLHAEMEHRQMRLDELQEQIRNSKLEKQQCEERARLAAAQIMKLEEMAADENKDPDDHEV